MLGNPHFQFDIDRCGNCGMDHGRVSGPGTMSPAPTIIRPDEVWKPVEFELRCMVCNAHMGRVTEDAVLRYMDIIASVLMYNDLEPRGVFVGSDFGLEEEGEDVAEGENDVYGS